MASISSQISFLWNKKLEDAIGAGHPDPWGYADKHPDVVALRASLKRVERAQARQGQAYRTRSRNF